MKFLEKLPKLKTALVVAWLSMAPSLSLATAPVNNIKENTTACINSTIESWNFWAIARTYKVMSAFRKCLDPESYWPNDLFKYTHRWIEYHFNIRQNNAGTNDNDNTTDLQASINQELQWLEIFDETADYLASRPDITLDLESWTFILPEWSLVNWEPTPENYNFFSVYNTMYWGVDLELLSIQKNPTDGLDIIAEYIWNSWHEEGKRQVDKFSIQLPND